MSDITETLLYGEPLEKVPDDLFIPPDALQVFLDSFQGPLDLLLYLIKKQNFDILDIPITQITSQYLKYIDQIKSENFELAGEYLLMAAILIDIKTRILLPKTVSLDIDDEDLTDDPRAELVKQLLEYEKFKIAALKIDKLPRLGRDWSSVKAFTKTEEKKQEQQITPDLIFDTLQHLLKEGSLKEAHTISAQNLSVREFMSALLKIVGKEDQIALEFIPLIEKPRRKAKLIVVFIAILELARQGSIEISQSSYNSPIWILKTAT